MGTRKLETISVQDRRAKGETVADMWRHGWKVQAYCERCELTLRVELEVVIRCAGPGLSHWNKVTPCKRVGCHGRMAFKAFPRGGRGFDYLGPLPRLWRNLKRGGGARQILGAPQTLDDGPWRGAPWPASPDDT